nr:hypothetical protein Iba_chr04dCG13880 [Ipomoea batatas]
MINHLFSPGCKQVRRLEAITHDVEPNQINQEHLPDSQGRVGGGDTESSSSTVLLLSNSKGRAGNIVVGCCFHIRRGGRGVLASSSAIAAGRFVREGGEPWRRDADNTTNTVRLPQPPLHRWKGGICAAKWEDGRGDVGSLAGLRATPPVPARHSSLFLATGSCCFFFLLRPALHQVGFLLVD